MADNNYPEINSGSSQPDHPSNNPAPTNFNERHHEEFWDAYQAGTKAIKDNPVGFTTGMFSRGYGFYEQPSPNNQYKK